MRQTCRRTQHHLDHRLLAGPQGRAAAHREPHRLAHLVLVACPGSKARVGGVGRVGDEIVAVLLDRNAERPDQRLAGELAIARRPAAPP